MNSTWSHGFIRAITQSPCCQLPSAPPSRRQGLAGSVHPEATSASGSGKFNVALLGAAGGIGQPLALLLKQCVGPMMSDSEDLCFTCLVSACRLGSL